jgi:Neuraminidase (sialidase)
MLTPSRKALMATIAIGALVLGLVEYVSASTASRRAPSPWQEPMQLSSPGGGTIFASLTASGSSLYVAFQRGDSIYLRTSPDEGATWTNPTFVTSATELPLTEPLVALGSTVHLAYARGNNLYYRRSTDRGSTWSRETLISKGLGNHFYRLSLDVSGTKVHLAWVQHDRNTFATTSLYYRRSLDGGLHWQRTKVLVPEANQPGRPALSVRGTNVHLAWTDERDKNPPCYTYPACPEVYYKHSRNNGATWTSDRRMTFGHGATIGRPDVLALPDGAVSLVWQNDLKQEGQEEIFSTYSHDGGKTWSKTQRLTFTPHESEHPATAGFGTTELLVWFDRRQPGTQNEYARLSTNGGKTWGAEEQITDNGQTNAAAQVAVTANFAHAVWPVNNDYIEYSRRPRPQASQG